MLAAHGRASDGAPGVTLVPSHDRRGTNCVLCSPPDVLPFAFGHDSFEPHCEAARAQGIAPRIIALPGLGLDIDTPDDLRAFMARPAAGPHPRLSPRERYRRASPGDRRGLKRMHEATPRSAFGGAGGRRPDAAEALALAAEDDLAPLLDCAAALRDRATPIS